MAGGGGGGKTQQTQTAEPWAGAQPYLLDAYRQASGAAAATPTTPFNGNFANPANDTQRTAVNMGRTAAGGLQTGQGVADVANASLRGDMLSNNPHLQPAIDGTNRPTVSNATDMMLPAVGITAGQSGAFGGTRQAMLEGMVVRDVNQQVADTAAQMWNDNFARERGIQTQVAPQMLDIANRLNMAPAQAMLEVGNQEYSLDDLTRQDNQLRFEDEINRHWRAINPLIAALGGLGMPGGTTTVNAQGARANPSGAALGGAAAGAAAGVPLAGATYGLSIPIGALIGGGMGYFGAR